MTVAQGTRRLKHWGWGYEDQQPAHDEVAAAGRGMREQLGFAPAEVEQPVPLGAVELRAPRLDPPTAMAEICAQDPHARALHALGKSYRDVVRGFRGEFPNPPDVVAYPRDEADVERVLDWCATAGAAAIPFGGGTSVCAGVEGVALEDRPLVTIDLRGLDRVLEVDDVSRAARIQGGAAGPVLEEQLRPHGLTLRHFPQSFEYSTLGGWIATRAGGHFATGPTHIDDLVESIRALTPSGLWESRRLPASGAGPSPDRMLIGSEGILGVITEAWVRVRARPGFRASAGIGFPTFANGADAVRELAQSGLAPSNCRLLDPREAALTGAASDGRAMLVLGFESADHPLDAWLARALECCADHSGAPDGEPKLRTPKDENGGSGRGAAEGTWRDAFLRAPYLRDTMVAAGILAETYETAITWDRLDAFVEEARGAAEEALEGARVTCRLTHAYPDGAAPYFTVLAPARRGAELDQWQEMKQAASDAVLAAGGTITHHHAVGRDHRPWYDRQRPKPFAAALRAAKQKLDPLGILNPGVLIDP
jgi:alkyldihydroxyacetonephosphate synthase